MLHPLWGREANAVKEEAHSEAGAGRVLQKTSWAWKDKHHVTNTARPRHQTHASGGHRAGCQGRRGKTPGAVGQRTRSVHCTRGQEGRSSTLDA